MIPLQSLFKIRISHLFISIFTGIFLAQGEVSYSHFYPQSAHLVPLTEKSNLQKALDEFHVIRLEPADYQLNNSLKSLTLKSGYRIYGIGSRLPDMTIEPGTENLVLSSVQGTVIFPENTNKVTRHNLFRRITYSRFEVHNSQVEENLFIDLGWNSMDVDTRSGGFFRNNRILRFGSQVDKTLADPVIRFRGDINRASGGNTIVGGNFLGTPANYFDNQFSLNLLGPGDESYASDGFPFLKTGPMGLLNIWQSFGLMASGKALDCEADEAVIFAFDQNSATKPVIRLGPSQGSALIMNNNEPDVNVGDENPKGFRMFGMNGGGEPDKPITVDKIIRPAAITNAQADKMRSLVMRDWKGSWELPAFGPIADPAGTEWAKDRSLKPSASDMIQALINRDSIALLPAGIYYLDKPIILGRRSRGLIGAGQDSTVLIAKDPTMNLVEMDSIPLDDPEAPGFTLADLTLQGGKNGIFQKWRGGKNLQFYDCRVSHLTIRDMSEGGLHFTDIYAWDNNLFDELTFYRCASGVKQATVVRGEQKFDTPTLNYMDKVMFLHSRWIECGKAMDMVLGRASNANWFVNCRFEGNTEYVWRSNHYPIFFVNSDVINNRGNPVINNFGPLYLIGNRFEAGALSSGSFVNTLSSLSIAECSFKGNGKPVTVVPKTAPDFMTFMLTHPDNLRHYTHRRIHFFNSTSDVALGGVYNGMLFNNSFSANPNLSREWVNLDDSVATILMPAQGHPTAQLLAGKAFPSGMSSYGGSLVKPKNIRAAERAPFFVVKRFGANGLQFVFKNYEGANIKEVELLSLKGERVLSRKLDSKTASNQILFNSVPTGTYIVVFHTNQEIRTALITAI